MSQKIIGGINPVIAGTFKDDGSLDLDRMGRLIDHEIKIGANGITMFGIATEFHKLTDNERNDLAALLVEKVKNTDVFSVMSVTDHSTEVAVARAKYYESLGADCLMVLPPFFLNPTIEQIKEHIFSILEAVKIPVLVQYAPGETKKLIPVEEMATIEHKYQNAIFKLEPNPPMDYVRGMLKLAPKAKILIGYAGLYMLDVMEAGGAGTMPGCSFTEIYLEIERLWKSGDRQAAHELHEKLMKYVRIWMSHPEYIIKVEKVILKKRGIIDSDYCRKPEWTLTAKDYEDIDNFLAEFSYLLNK